MRLHFRCPCGAVCNVPTTAIGKAGECPTCGKVVVVPTNAIIVSDAPPPGGMLIPRPRTTPLPGTMTAVAVPPGVSTAVAELDEIPAELLAGDDDAFDGALEAVAPAPSQALRTSPTASKAIRQTPSPSQAMSVSPTASKAIRKTPAPSGAMLTASPSGAMRTASPTSSKAVSKTSRTSKA